MGNGEHTTVVVIDNTPRSEHLDLQTGLRSHKSLAGIDEYVLPKVNSRYPSHVQLPKKNGAGSSSSIIKPSNQEWIKSSETVS